MKHPPSLLTRLLALPNADAPPRVPGASTQLRQARAQILTVLLVLLGLFGSVSLAFSVPSLVQRGHSVLLAIYSLVLLATWAAALVYRGPYWLRAPLALAVPWCLAVIELLCFGYSEDAIIYLVAVALYALLLAGWRVGALGWLGSLATLIAFGLALSSGAFVPLVQSLKVLDPTLMVITWVVFASFVGTAQAGVAVLFHQLEQSLHAEHALRLELETERVLLDRRVAERTHDLQLARTAADQANTVLAAQNRYLAALHQTTVALLNHHDRDRLLQQIVVSAAAILDAPFGEVMLLEGEELVVCAFTANQPALQGDRVRRSEALLSWQAVDTLRPVTLDDYAAWSGARSVYATHRLYAVADFPIVAGQTCLGVLAVGRDTPSYGFSPEQLAQGEVFAHLVAVVLDNAHLYATARQELAERTQAQAALVAMAETLKAQNAELDAFARTVAHDIKSPLTAVVTLAYLLAQDHQRLDAERITSDLNTIANQGYKIAAIVDALLLLAATTNAQALPLSPLAMESIVAEVPGRLAGLIADAEATLVVPAAWPTAVGYAPWVEEVWVNYVSNAIKYGGARPTVTLGADLAGDGMVRFWVRDTGVGLSEAQQASLFTPFTRLHRDQAPGYGLGLSIVQRIVSRLGGSVAVESRLGAGSIFSFSLPAGEVEAVMGSGLASHHPGAP
jgi:signal transduction histidine kinase